MVAAPALAGALLVTGLAAWPASAHSALISSTPADGATVEAPLTSVELIFNEAVQSEFAQLVVLGDDGVEYQTGAPQIVGGTVTQGVDSPPDGGYSLSYRVVSADGHPVEGTLTFTMAAGSSAPEPTVPFEPTSDAPTESPSDSVSESVSEHSAGHEHSGTEDANSDSAWILSAVGGAAVVAVLAFAMAGGRRRRPPGDTETDER